MHLWRNINSANNPFAEFEFQYKLLRGWNVRTRFVFGIVGSEVVGVLRFVCHYIVSTNDCR